MRTGGDVDALARMSPLERLLDLLDIETIEADVFRGWSPPETRVRVFGGQVAAQALVAAVRTVGGEHLVHSLHAYFLRAGDPSSPIVYEVDRIRNGRSYVTRRVVGIQAGRAIFNLQASFARPEGGYDHQIPMPDVPGPEHATPRDESDLPAEARVDFLNTVRPVVALTLPGDDPYTRRVWMRAAGTIGGDDRSLHLCVFTYMSDLTLLGATVGPHLAAGERPGYMASLDHAMWFHRPFRADQWLLYDQQTASASAGRGMARGRVFTRDGTLVASVAQEGVIRPPRPA